MAVPVHRMHVPLTYSGLVWSQASGLKIKLNQYTLYCVITMCRQTNSYYCTQNWQYNSQAQVLFYGIFVARGDRPYGPPADWLSTSPSETGYRRESRHHNLRYTQVLSVLPLPTKQSQRRLPWADMQNAANNNTFIVTMTVTKPTMQPQSQSQWHTK